MPPLRPLLRPFFNSGILALMVILSLLPFRPLTQAHNVTKILAQHPDFSTFNHYLTLTHLAPEINQRTTITVCAVHNAAMNQLLSKHLSIYSIKNILSLHVLLDYFGAKKLHQITHGTALAATMFQATGSAPGSSGFVNITDLKGGKVGFSPEDSGGGKIDAYFVKSVHEIPYNISVIQISKILLSDVAEAPTPGPSELNLTGLMSALGCKVFADTLSASDAEKTFEDSAQGGLTVFCPLDDVFKAFLPKYKNLTAAAKKALLEYHGVPVYMSMSMLQSNNGIMNTLATEGAKKFDFTVQNQGEEVTLKTKIVMAKITGTLLDKQPVAIYTIDKVLKPQELFKGEAEAPKAQKDASSPDSESPESDVANETADDNGGAGLGGWRIGLAGVYVGVVGLVLL